MFRPVIGITSYIEPASWGSWVGVSAGLVPHAYIAKVEQAGGIALVVPPRLDADADWADQVLARVDGLVLAGGVDIEPRRYGADRHPAVQDARADRDAAELSLAAAAVEADLPLLGICRGMQVMAVAAGGQLEQHLPDRVGHARHAPGRGSYGSHPVRIAAGSMLAAILGQQADVPSYHHQAVAEHPGYTATAWDTADDTVEGMEDPSGRFRLAVQWHPEVAEDPRLFSALVAACGD
jgi:putative glutamine amidotransferase